MTALPWKLSTFAALGTAMVLAIHPIRSPSSKETTGGPSAATSSISSQGGVFGWFMGGASDQAATSGSAKLLAQLRLSRSSSASCEPMRALTYTADEEATAQIADLAQRGRLDVRQCAIDALGDVRLGSARSWLEELVNDRELDIRKAALTALAGRAEDLEARAFVMTAARTGDSPTRLAALLALGNAHVAEATPLLLEAVQGADLQTQQELVVAIGRAEDPSSVDALTKISREGPTGLRAVALSALG